MKYLIASDIHGSALWLEKLLLRFREEKADVLVLLGDILYHGPRNDLPEGYNPKKCIELLNSFEKNILAVRGNCEAAVDQTVLNFPVMSQTGVIDFGSQIIYLVHSGEELSALKGNAIVLCGHTHVQGVFPKGDIVYINPGSVSLPKNGNPHTYMVLQNREFTIKTFDEEVTFSYKF